MKKCVNCYEDNRDGDKYCRNCGCFLHSNTYYILYKVFTILLFIAILLMIALFVASYFITKK